jgi:hypothetical protein
MKVELVNRAQTVPILGIQIVKSPNSSFYL